MKFRKFLCALIVALFSLQTLQFTARADEGMWTFNNVPRAEIKKKYGFDVTDEWLQKVQLASVRFNNGGSGSFVSPNGLVLTNYHIVEDIVGEVSTPEKDLAKEGFVARTARDEIKAPSLELNVLMSIEDVTARVNGAVKAGMSDAEAFAARAQKSRPSKLNRPRRPDCAPTSSRFIRAANTIFIATRSTPTCVWCSCLSFRQRSLAAIRTTSIFRASTSTWRWCASTKTISRCSPASYFKWSKTGAKEGDLVFVTGHPGSTSRLNTVAHLEQLRDTSIPIILRLLERREAMLKKYMTHG